ncbi:M99 family carboxypeptidase catalytic domain-containing protein [Campylobacter gastrosuis]|uniref:Deacylase n=1 Tax=Campylobacter gastrosuis TaxID=2974576 RepID=A0ABT7HR61_9BACT|nr:M99 family carboxypeptidase catalytic domain-containing protein [Campylobacter gastrosuis]MDL0089399.1 deacylase [Campylobacter gastrosuis]
MRFFVAFFMIFIASLNANNLDFAFIKKGTPSDNTMLLIGGIQGDEPGGFLAASIVATDYNITQGSLWVVPNLNFPSIIQRARGTKGDMNRKFAHVDVNDPDYKAVINIKKIISDKNVSLVLNLHDGSGFYSDTYVNADINPKKWGSTCIIDQARLEGAKYPDLIGIASKIKDTLNTKILNSSHTYHVKNTKTAEGDLEMLKSLTYYAVTQNKSAFANEASKNLNAEERTFYHLVAIEEYMRIVGIKFTRPFELNVKNVKKAIEKEIRLSFFDDMFVLNLMDMRPNLNYIPLKKGSQPLYSSSNPLVAVIKDSNGYKVQYGNRFVTRLVPQYFDYAKQVDFINVFVDGRQIKIKSGDKIQVKHFFNIERKNGIRANVIGYGSGLDESEENIYKKNMMSRYSVDKSGKIYRVELYETPSNKFAGMFLVEFL